MERLPCRFPWEMVSEEGRKRIFALRNTPRPFSVMVGIQDICICYIVSDGDIYLQRPYFATAIYFAIFFQRPDANNPAPIVRLPGAKRPSPRPPRLKRRHPMLSHLFLKSQIVTVASIGAIRALDKPRGCDSRARFGTTIGPIRTRRFPLTSDRRSYYPRFSSPIGET